MAHQQSLALKGNDQNNSLTAPAYKQGDEALIDGNRVYR
jgi:hypothetical protein